MKPKLITLALAMAMLDGYSRGEYVRRGTYYTVEDGMYIGIDNRTGDMWMEEFRSKHACFKWLGKEYEPPKLLYYLMVAVTVTLIACFAVRTYEYGLKLDGFLFLLVLPKLLYEMIRNGYDSARALRYCREDSKRERMCNND